MRIASMTALSIALVLALAAPAAAQQEMDMPTMMGQNQTEALKINDQIYQASGFGNTFMVRTSEGNVIIDTSISFAAQRHKKLLTAVDAGPIKYIILTHAHGDHTGGVRLWKQEGTQIIAQRNHVEFQNYQARLAPFFAWRNAAQFGRGVAGDTSKMASPGNRSAKIEATILFDDEYKFELGGVTFICMRTPGETPDHLTVWIPQLKAAFCGDNYYMSFPNMYTLRGTTPRWALDYTDSLEKVMALKPEILLPSHGSPIAGNDAITKTLTKYREAILYVHDATVKGMNEGKDVFTLMKEIKLPPGLDVGEGYGRISWSVRGIYEGYVGWFDGNPATMFDTPPSEAYPEVVKLAGGPDAVAKRAAEFVAAGDLLKGIHLADMALAADPAHKGALEARLAALQGLKAKSTNFNERSWLDYGIRQAKTKLGGDTAR